MSQVNAFWRQTATGHLHWCPGCEAIHVIPLSWEFNGNFTLPTFKPSVRHTWGHAATLHCCHYNITDGKVTYHPDCTHWLAGSIVALPPLPVEYTGDNFNDGVK